MPHASNSTNATFPTASNFLNNFLIVGGTFVESDMKEVGKREPHRGEEREGEREKGGEREGERERGGSVV
jgi:hypothetical protein